MDERALTPDDFSAFFRDVHDREPFPWQKRLTERVLGRHSWPEVIDLPTGVGKTAAIDTAVFSLAARPEVFPRRIVFVIDRRIVVDQVCERARRIRDRVQAAETPTLRRVKERLDALCGGEPLGVAALRGGIPRENEWADRPDQPWIMVSTVDQFGSRLLFRGYGVRPLMRPIHAGLAGNDCLVILDEVHLSVPFAETLSQVAALRFGELPRRFAVVKMSATPNNDTAERFTLQVEDLHGCTELHRRVEAAKEAELVSVRNHDALPAGIVKIVKSTAGTKIGGGLRSVGVVVNRVRTARETHRALEEAGYKAHLITGRMRPLDRLGALARIEPAVDPDGEGGSGELAVVVATQAIEVGADFSFDALITECAAVDSLRQRFGRLDRRGDLSTRTGAPARAWIVGPKTVVAPKKPDPIYGDSVRVTWEELERRAEEGPIDVGPRALCDFPEEAAAPKTSAPLLLKTHMDAWSQTSPEPIVQPPLEWFLHGIDQDRETDVSILWRWDRSREALRVVPPRQAEFLQVPIGAARSWLSDGREVDVADVALAGPGADEYPVSDGDSDGWVRWAGFGKEPERIGVGEIGPGDILVVNPTRGGLGAGTWDPSSKEEVEDLGDYAQLEHRRRATLRLDPRLRGIERPPSPSEEIDADVSARDRVRQWLDLCEAKHQDLPDHVVEIVRRLCRDFEIEVIDPDSEGPGGAYFVLTERHSETRNPIVDADAMDGSDESGSMIGTGVTLRRHLEGVGEQAAQIAERLGLGELAGDLRLAGRLHDIGKVDRRFQAQLAGGDPIALTMGEEPLAKSLPGARGHGGYPRGMRHEIASVAMIESNSDTLGSARDEDLVLHLVGAHHGWGRPLLPIVEDPEPQMLRYTFDGHHLEADSNLADGPLALDMADRFWRLVERYGYYGLAWLEAVFRLADYRQSAKEAGES